MDYEVFLLSAVKENYDKRGNARAAIQAGVAGTGRVITAAAAIMIMVFLSFVPINDVSIKMMGLGLAAAVLIDVTIIRMMLAPALLGILGDAAWRGIGRRPAPAQSSADEGEPVPAH
jgi:RND superfamily putative drug exporter